jgi:hypothetical protein
MVILQNGKFIKKFYKLKRNMGNDKQSSVEWLFEQVCNLDWRNISGEEKLKTFEQAKSMHEKEIEHSYLTCYQEYTADGKHWEMGMSPKETFEDYYNEKYKK